MTFVQIKHSLDRLSADMAVRARAMPAGTAQGLNWTMAKVRRAEIAEIDRAFDRPTRWTRNAPRYRPATPDRLVAVIELQDDMTGGVNPASYLTPQIIGGARRQKRFEKLLTDAQVLPAGWFAIPGNGARMDRFGNMRPSQIVEVLSAMRAFRLAGSDMNRTERSKRRNRRLKDYFVSHPNAVKRTAAGGRLPYGVYERKRDGTITTVLRFRPRVTYTKRLRWYEVAEQTIRQHRDRDLNNAIERAVRLARKAA